MGAWHQDPGSLKGDCFMEIIKSPVKAIHAFCIDCSGGSSSEVRSCMSANCPLHPFRFGKNPFIKREMTDEQKQAWSVIGSINGTNWDTDFPMEKQADGTYLSKDVFDMAVGNEFKVRQGASWDVNFGGDGQPNGANFIVETAGKYKVKLTINADNTAVLELVAQ